MCNNLIYMSSGPSKFQVAQSKTRTCLRHSVNSKLLNEYWTKVKTVSPTTNLGMVATTTKSAFFVLHGLHKMPLLS